MSDRSNRRKAERLAAKHPDRLPALDPASPALLLALERSAVGSFSVADIPAWVREESEDLISDDKVECTKSDMLGGFAQLIEAGLAMPLACGIVLLAWERPLNFIGHYADMRGAVDQDLLVEPCDAAKLWISMLDTCPHLLVFHNLRGWRGGGMHD